ncbi:unnamed protein product [Sphagnum jensenii]|uniref:Uncharacterized protein n=1 Tax=Sphagnum jensenii TaxID=128206 RepID=A0ABP0VID7_9BRYO
MFGLQQSAMIDSIRLTNTCGNPLLVDIYLLREAEGIGQTSFIAYRFLFRQPPPWNCWMAVCCIQKQEILFGGIRTFRATPTIP